MDCENCGACCKNGVQLTEEELRVIVDKQKVEPREFVNFMEINPIKKEFVPIVKVVNNYCYFA